MADKEGAWDKVKPELSSELWRHSWSLRELDIRIFKKKKYSGLWMRLVKTSLTICSAVRTNTPWKNNFLGLLKCQIIQQFSKFTTNPLMYAANAPPENYEDYALVVWKYKEIQLLKSVRNWVATLKISKYLWGNK